MKYLILIRHGEFDEGKEILNEKGREQIKNIATKIKEFKPKIYSSLGPRSIESATILAQKFEMSFTSLEIFHSMDHADEVLELLKRSDENVVIVSRGEFITPFTAYFAKDFLGKDTEIRPIPKGNGVIFDIELGTCATIFA